MGNTGPLSTAARATPGVGEAGLRPAGADAGQRGVRVAVDALGGDSAPEEVVAGAVQAAATPGIQPEPCSVTIVCTAPESSASFSAWLKRGLGFGSGRSPNNALYAGAGRLPLPCAPGNGTVW